MQIAHEFCLILQVDKLEENFERTWSKYTNVVVDYTEASKTKSKELTSALREDDFEGVFMLHYHAFLCLIHTYYITCRFQELASPTMLGSFSVHKKKEKGC